METTNQGNRILYMAIRCGVVVQCLRAPSGPYKPKKMFRADQQTRGNSFESLLENKMVQILSWWCMLCTTGETYVPCRGTCLGAGVNYGFCPSFHNRLDIVIENIICDISSEHCDHIYQASIRQVLSTTFSTYQLNCGRTEY